MIQKIIILFALVLICISYSKPPESHRVIPLKIPFTDSLLNHLKLPNGFTIKVFAKNLGNARMIAVSQDSTIFITCPEQGCVYALKDTNNDGTADVQKKIISSLKAVHGITLYKNSIFLATPEKVYRLDLKPFTGKYSEIFSLVPGGRHPNRTMAISADSTLFLSIGSSCNDCIENDSLYASIITTDLKGKSKRIYAKGLRNTIGFDWHPTTGQLWGMDQGVDNRGDTLPPEELNLLQKGHNYGWPFVYGNNVIDTFVKGKPRGFNSVYEFAQAATPPYLTYAAHNSPIGFVFYKADQFPSYYHDGAFITFRGSWNRKPPSGYKVVFLKFESGIPTKFEDFITGFLLDESHQFARLSGIAVSYDGSLLFCDDDNGILYRVSYTLK